MGHYVVKFPAFLSSPCGNFCSREGKREEGREKGGREEAERQTKRKW